MPDNDVSKPLASLLKRSQKKLTPGARTRFIFLLALFNAMFCLLILLLVQNRELAEDKSEMATLVQTLEEGLEKVVAGAQETVVVVATQIAQVKASLDQTPTPAPPTAYPSYTPYPTYTSVPTDTPVPPTPTPTLPFPTATPVPPTPTNTLVSPTPTPTSPSPTVTSLPPTSTPLPTHTPYPTYTLLPTYTLPPILTFTPTPTPTLTPTPTPTFSRTPTPSDTPIPASPPPPPQVLAVNPTQGDNDADFTIIITGTNFQTDPTASLVDGGKTALATTYLSSTTLNAVIPAWFTAGYYDLTVTNPDLQSGTLLNAFTLTNPIPLITGVNPYTGTDNVNTNVTISGSYFVSGLSARLGVFSLTATWVNSITLNTTVPGTIMPGGPYTLTLSNPGPLTPTDSLTDAFTVTLSSIFGYTPTCSISTTNCDDAYGPPDGDQAEIDEGGYLTFTFPAGSGIRNGPGYDFVFFEYPNPDDPNPDIGGIEADWIMVDISEDGNNWHQVFYWGDNITDANTNVAPHNYNGDAGELDNEFIRSGDLWPRAELTTNTGVAIDIGIISPSQGSQYHYIRFSCPIGGSDAAQVDGIERLH